MRLASLHIENFRGFSDDTLYFNDYTCLVGPNGSGKSTILVALNLFFRETKHSTTDLLTLSEEDFHAKDTSKPIRITVTFDRLSDDAQQDFSDYYRNDKLIVTAEAVWDPGTESATVKQFGQREAITKFAPFFKAEAEGTKVADLKELYSSIRDEFDALPAPGTKQAMMDALRDYETNHRDRCDLIPSEDQFYGFSKGTNRLSKYIQWVFVPAVKDASTEQLEGRDTALATLLDRTVRASVNFGDPLDALRKKMVEEYEKIVDGQQDKLDELSTRLGKVLRNWAHPGASLQLEWFCDQKKSVRLDPPYARILAGEGAFIGELARFGHGLQRSFLLTILQELARIGAGEGPRLLLGCEEPELYQHPPQARHMASVFHKLSQENAQVLVCTHSPHFVTGRTFEDVRRFRIDPKTAASSTSYVTYEKIAKDIGDARGDAPQKPETLAVKLAQTLQPEVNEIFFSGMLILVEGPEDVAHINTYILLMNKLDEFRSLHCHVVAVGSKNELLQPIAITNCLTIPTFVVCDADTDKITAKKNDQEKAAPKADNIAIQKLCGIEHPNAEPDTDVWSNRLVMWRTNLTKTIADELGEQAMQDAATAVSTKYNLDPVSKKNGTFVGYRLAEAWEAGHKSANLTKLCEAILTFAGGKPAS